MRIPFALFLFLLLTTSGSGAQTPKPWNSLPEETDSARRSFPPQLRSEPAQIRDAALEDDYAYRQLEHLTDSIGPRPGGSPQADAAVNYVAEELLQFLSNAKDSLFEVETQLELARHLSYLTTPQAETLASKVSETGRLLSGLMRAYRPAGTTPIVRSPEPSLTPKA